MSRAQEHLAQYNVTVAQARQFILDNLDDVPNIYQVCKTFGVTSDMLAEIYGGVTASQVRDFFASYGLQGSELDNVALSPVADPKALSDMAADQLATQAISQTSANFLSLLSDAVKTGGADLDLDGTVEYAAESSLYGGSGGDVATVLNYLVQVSGHLDSQNTEDLLLKVEAVGDLADSLYSNGGISAVAQIYGTPEMLAYYNAANSIAHETVWTSAAMPEQVGEALLTGINTAYELYTAYDIVLFL